MEGGIIEDYGIPEPTPLLRYLTLSSGFTRYNNTWINSAIMIIIVIVIIMVIVIIIVAGADLGGGCRGCAPPLIQLIFCKKREKLCGLLVLK